MTDHATRARELFDRWHAATMAGSTEGVIGYSEHEWESLIKTIAAALDLAALVAALKKVMLEAECWCDSQHTCAKHKSESLLTLIDQEAKG